VFYDRRPSVLVEPTTPWADGAVHLFELPADDEIHDNVIAFRVPDAPARRGTSHILDYRLHWVAEEPDPPSLARVVASRVGRAGIPGLPPGKGPDVAKRAHRDRR
jgi:glucans biosynthesis protein